MVHSSLCKYCVVLKYACGLLFVSCKDNPFKYCRLAPVQTQCFFTEFMEIAVFLMSCLGKLLLSLLYLVLIVSAKEFLVVLSICILTQAVM